MFQNDLYDIYLDIWIGYRQTDGDRKWLKEELMNRLFVSMEEVNQDPDWKRAKMDSLRNEGNEDDR